MKDNEEISKKLREKMGEGYANDNPYVSSPQFIAMVHLASLLPKGALSECSNSGEGVNAILSLMVSMVKNIPDPLWDRMTKTVEAQSEGNPTHAMWKALTEMRNYCGKNYMDAVFENNDEDDIPEFNAKAPTTPC